MDEAEDLYSTEDMDEHMLWLSLLAEQGITFEESEHEINWR